MTVEEYLRFEERSNILSRRMKKLSLLVLTLCFICLLSHTSVAQKCKFDKNGYKDVPTAHIETSIDFGKLTQIRGRVNNIFNEPMVAARIVLYKVSGSENIYVGSQETDVKGKFCFRRLNEGNYILLIGSENFNSLELNLTLVKKGRGAKRKIEAVLQVGT